MRNVLSKSIRPVLQFVSAAVILGACLPAPSPAAEPMPHSDILSELRNFEQTGRVLYVAAHPDDENTQLIGYFARGRHYRTAYLSLTRGDGGQNVLGPEFGDELGVIRTQELLAARRIDGGHQFFSRAIDFGFSKDYRETLRIWNRQEVLSDVVRVIREFRPDVIITRFSTEPGRTHGHHTASAVLALEAFKLAGDPNAFPDQLKELKPWQPKRIFWNAGGFQRGGDESKMIRINAGGDDPETGESFSEIAGLSRSMHKTQGFGQFRGGRDGGPRWESFELLAGDPATNDIMDGVDTNWTRFPGGAEIGKLSAEATANFKPENPAASVPLLLKIKTQLTALPDGPIIREKQRVLDRILQKCIGLTVSTTLPRAGVVPGETMNLHTTVSVSSDAAPVTWLADRYPDLKSGTEQIGEKLSAGKSVSHDANKTLPENTPLTQPYWLREPHGTGMFEVKNPDLIGRPENPPAFPIEHVFKVADETLIIPDQPVQASEEATNSNERHLEVISPVSLKFASATTLFAPGASQQVNVEVLAARPVLKGELKLKAPNGWKIEPASQNFHLSKAGDHADVSFTVTAPPEPATEQIAAVSTVDGKNYDNGRIVIDYPHIPRQLLQPPAQVKAVCLHLAVNAKRVGYLPGAGDNVADAIKDMGCTVTTLDGADLTTDKLKSFDAVVIGVRAFNVRDDLAPHMDALFNYVENGGTLIEQYNRPNGLKTEKLAPYDLHLSSERVTDEDAAVTFLAPDNPVLNTPNKVTPTDFDGWIQERGIYYPDRWDEHFTPILAAHDPGEQPLKGGLLVAHYGKGHIVYTGLVFFRQLPAGVPGAYRLFANLISLGQ